MPNHRDASAPKTSPTTTVIRMASTTASQGSQPRFRPFDSAFVTMFPSVKAATPASANWASETIPP